MSVSSFLNGELLNHKMQPAANGMEVAKWQPKASLVPLLDKFFAEVSQVDHTYQANADFMWSFAQSFGHKFKSEEEKLDAQQMYKHLSIYLSFALNLLIEREDLVQRYISFLKELNVTITKDEVWEWIGNNAGSIAAEIQMSYFSMYDVIFEQELEKYVEMKLEQFYKQ